MHQLTPHNGPRAHNSRIALLLFLGAILFGNPASAATLSSPWQTLDIGSPAVSGTVSLTSGVFTVTAGGADVWGSADQFRFVYQTVSGDADVIARVDALGDTYPWAKAGVMVRSDLSAGGANALMLISPERGTSFQTRTAANGATTNVKGSALAPPSWVRLLRTGTLVTGYVSADGTAWTKVSSATVALGATAYVGLAVTSHNVTTATTATISHVSVTRPTLPSPQKDADIGSPAVAGSASYAAGTYTVMGAGADIWGTADQFHYVYQAISGDLDVVAHVASIANTNDWAKAGVMVRESLTANARHALTLLSQGHGFAFQRRIDPGGFSASTSWGASTTSGWVRLKRTGYTFESYASADGATWTLIATDTVPMTDPVYVGIAVTSHAPSVATKALVDRFSVTQSTPPLNQPPTVTLTSPANGATFTAPASILVTANASDPERRLARVDFFSNATKIGSASASPFTMTWQGAAAGTYAITAEAFDADGASATSAAMTITVKAGSAPTTVTFHASADHTTTVMSYRLDVFANGADPNSAKAIATTSLGKPTPDANGNISVNEATFFSALAPGTYLATVSAVGSAGSSRSTAATFAR